MAEQLAPVGLVVDRQHTQAGERATAAFLGASPGASAASPRSVASVGSVTMNVEPRPTPSLCAVTRPPCPTTMIRASASPSPKVVWSRGVAPGCCRNGSNTCGRNAGSIPAPVSLMMSDTSLGPRVARTEMLPPTRVKRIAFESRLRSTC